MQSQYLQKVPKCGLTQYSSKSSLYADLNKKLGVYIVAITCMVTYKSVEYHI